MATKSPPLKGSNFALLAKTCFTASNNFELIALSAGLPYGRIEEIKLDTQYVAGGDFAKLIFVLHEMCCMSKTFAELESAMNTSRELHISCHLKANKEAICFPSKQALDSGIDHIDVSDALTDLRKYAHMWFEIGILSGLSFDRMILVHRDDSTCVAKLSRMMFELNRSMKLYNLATTLEFYNFPIPTSIRRAPDSSE